MTERTVKLAKAIVAEGIYEALARESENHTADEITQAAHIAQLWTAMDELAK